MTDAIATLIPELLKWNNGTGIDADTSTECVGRAELD